MEEYSGRAALDAANGWCAASNNPEFVFQQYERGRLLIVGGFDLAYYHELELEFHDVAYVDLPSRCEAPVFRQSTDRQCRALERALGLDEEHLMVLIDIGRERMPIHTPVTFRVVARSLTVRLGLVFHYQREHLKPGERIAPWVTCEHGKLGIVLR